MNKWSTISLTILIALVIGFLWFISQQSYGATVVPLLSGVLGFLLKSLSDTITAFQHRQWDLDDFAREQTIKYYESKLNEMSLFLVTELEKMTQLTWKNENGKWRVNDDSWEITREWLSAAATVRTFSKVFTDSEIVEGYKKTNDHLGRLGDLVTSINAGKFDNHEHDKLRAKLKNEISNYMEQIKIFQLNIEIVRLKVLRGELSLKISNSQ